MKTYWFKDVQLQMVGTDTYVDINNITGSYYDHDIGYVDISIGEPIRIYDTDNWPSSGSFIVTGTQATKARLTFVDVTQFRVDADTDGDGAYDDYSSNNVLWTDY
jgi:hypothetical protein